MPENTPAPDTAEPATGDAPRTSRVPRKILIGAAVAATVALGITALRWGNSTDPASATTKTPAAASSTTASPDPLTSSSPSSHQAPDHTGEAIDQAGKTIKDWSKSNPAADKHTVSSTPALGAGGRIHAVLRIPALGASWAEPVYEGTEDQQLRAGVGHFVGSAEPGQVGNFALAGHRSGVTNPPFKEIDRIKPGSQIKVTAADRNTYTYSVVRVRTVAPTDIDVLDPVPDQPNAVATKEKLTIVTCWPANGHSRRVVVEADLTAARGGAT
ncbi:sortase [Streptomyces noursei]|uniref:sortase n=1 Tax=Streptomyces noursei TaxID=1971 RepID=UPI001676C18A|nr:sortase [Streptomyces noursei]MCZ1021233.1 sortase [Streptomyces noursei]GGX53119.1 hypothetical protein GCM10010341_88020 [Streptomyces noursei]